VPWVVRIVPSTVDQARGVFARARVVRWLAIVPAARAGREAARDLLAAAGERLRLETLEAGSWSNRDDLRQRLSTAGPEAVLVWLASAREGGVVVALRAVGYTGSVVRRSQAAAPLEAYARDAAGLAVRVLRGPHGSEPRLAFPFTGTFVGATGRLTFDSNGNRILVRSSPS
jgi:hypothetical protein